MTYTHRQRFITRGDRAVRNMSKKKTKRQSGSGHFITSSEGIKKVTGRQRHAFAHLAAYHWPSCLPVKGAPPTNSTTNSLTSDHPHTHTPPHPQHSPATNSRLQQRNNSFPQLPPPPVMRLQCQRNAPLSHHSPIPS